MKTGRDMEAVGDGRGQVWYEPEMDGGVVVRCEVLWSKIGED